MFLKPQKKAFIQTAPYYMVSGGGGGIALTYIGAVTPSVSGQVLTATSAPIGTAASNRLVVVLFTDVTGVSETSATVTIGGNAATVNTITNGPFPPCIGIASLVVTTGTTATIVVTLNGSGASLAHFEIYTITGLSSTTAVGSNSIWDSGTDPLSTTLATSSGGVVLAMGIQQTISSSTNTISGTETYTQDNTPINISGSGFGSVAHATGTATNASSTVTFTTGQTGHLSVSAVSFK